MSDFPDPEEEFELMYGDELELMDEQNLEDEDIAVLPAPNARKSLDFNTPTKTNSQSDENIDHNASFVSGCLEIDNETVGVTTEKETERIETTLHTDLNDVNHRKRTVNELFGDVDDLFETELDEIYSAPKKLCEDEKYKKDMNLIKLIVQKRNDYKQTHNLNSIGINTNPVSRDLERNKRNISLEVPKYPFIRIKNFAKENIYIRYHSEKYEEDESKRIVKESNSVGALGDNFQKVLNEAQEMIYKETTEQLTENRDIEMVEESNKDNQLWVELYKPKRYLELLSDESTNRTILRWIKLWDKVVFHRNPKIKVTQPLPSDNKKFFKFNELNTKLDEHGRPEHKVVLLCGPPGLGKTTLAHMVARHAGYNVIEINASDDRSIDSFRTALENATQMHSVIDREKRPNCIVFDEIDGAPPPSIDYLVKFIQGDVKPKGRKSKNKENTPSILKRPIICICNDVYVPALRPLRQISFVINFPQTSSVRLAERLVEICRRQQIKTDMGAMTALAEKSNNDIRSCLSVLHFFKTQNKPIGLSDIYKTNIGQKDMQKGLFTIWKEMFEIKRMRKLTGGSSAPAMKERMQNILSLIGSFGDHERVAQGVFENYPNLNTNINLEDTAHALDWFCFNDIFNKQIYTTQNYTLMGYLNYAFVVWHFAFARFQKEKITYPSAGYEAKAKALRQKAIVAEVLRGMSPLVRSYNSAIPLLLDSLPQIIRVISPPLRPVSLHLYSEEEKNSLLRVASIMADYNLNYIQQRKPDGAYEYNLEPNIEDLVVFDISNNRRKLPSYSNRQLIAREIEAEKMRRFEAQSGKNSVETSKVVNKKSEDSRQAVDASKKPELPNHLQRLKSKTISQKSVGKAAVRKDFFGRVIKCPAPSPAFRKQFGGTN
ncbi:chromosome transmission fidelity protein 18 homolog isoform X2 [Sitophilus oryzae]|uniref:Chromosome transmission fidelity protein 18 homolog isoform X2 n=1 Tax=Sitophilus oryzae TaxID=7048 RepID=A0A6J2Y1L5_SITOR|nr:chromosome transmission fidelity protein 18 homolog isoform X2 [Sitophilus oryzae]